MPRPIDAELNSSPFRINFEVTLADGTSVASRGFIPEESWNALNDEQRLAEVRAGLEATTAAIFALVEKHGFPDVTVG